MYSYTRSLSIYWGSLLLQYRKNSPAAGIFLISTQSLKLDQQMFELCDQDINAITIISNCRWVSLVIVSRVVDKLNSSPTEFLCFEAEQLWWATYYFHDNHHNLQILARRRRKTLLEPIFERFPLRNSYFTFFSRLRRANPYGNSLKFLETEA